MKKVFAIMLTLACILCMLPMSTFAAKENFIKLTEVTINEVPSPAAGTEVQFSANCTTQYVEINTIKWYEKKNENESGTALAKGAKFKPGYYYTVSVELKISNNAYYFAGNGADVNATINGHAATTSTNSAAVMSVNYTFPMCLGTVSKFVFNIATPTVGAAPHYPLLTGTGYESNNRGNNGAAYENGIYWRNETDNKVLYPRENPKFEEGKTYSANVTVATTIGYRVASSYTVTVNGKAVTSQRIDNECITFKVEFTVPKAHTHTQSDWKTDDTNHWKVCTKTDCNAIVVGQEAHKDTNKDNKCDVCSYAIQKADDTTNTPDSAQNSGNISSQTKPDEPDSTNPSDSESTMTDGEMKDTSKNNVDKDDKKEDNNDILVWVILGGVVLLAIGGVITIVILKKKKK